MLAACLSYSHRFIVFQQRSKHTERWKCGEQSLMWQRTFRDLLISSPILAFHEEADSQPPIPIL